MLGVITDADAEKACDWLRDTADEYAQARANRVLLEEGRKRLKAVLMAEHLSKPITAQEREAYADQRYKDYLDGLAEAVRREQRYIALREAAVMRVEAWRSMSANQRGRI